jgi:hypothetical protein
MGQKQTFSMVSLKVCFVPEGDTLIVFFGVEIYSEMPATMEQQVEIAELYPSLFYVLSNANKYFE